MNLNRKYPIFFQCLPKLDDQAIEQYKIKVPIQIMRNYFILRKKITEDIFILEDK